MSADASNLSVTGLRVCADDGRERRTLVAGVDFTVGAGESIAIVGESGSGKSLSARAAIGLLPSGLHATGSVRLDGRELLGQPESAWSKVRGSELALVLQDPFTTLNPLAKCGRQITDGPVLRRASRAHRREEAVRRLAEVGIADPAVADRYPFQLSGGMRQRVALAAALAGDPRFLIADEFSTALDVTTQREILLLLQRVQAARGMGLVIITHDLRMAFAICDRVYVLYAGSVLEVGGGASIEAEPLHPYTLGLLLSEPDVARRRVKLEELAGSVPSADGVADQCAFAARCRWRQPTCVAGKPPLVAHGEARATACVRIGEIRGEMAERPAAISLAAVPAPAASDAPRLLTVTGLVKQFHGGVRALAGVDVAVGINESVGIVGESGSGKTTLARCIVGLERPTSGTIATDDVDLSDWRALDADVARTMRRTIQYVFQDPYSSLNPTRTIGAILREAVAVGAGRQSRADGARRVGELLELVRLPASYASRKPAALSGGERQRVAIARSLAVEPQLIICDEPVSALDVSVQAQLLNLFADIQQATGVSYLFISHDLAVVRQVTERVYVLYKGAVVEQGATEQVLDHPQHPYTQQLVASIPGMWAVEDDALSHT